MVQSHPAEVVVPPAVHRHRLPAPPLGQQPPEDAAILLFALLAAARPDAPAALLDSSDHARTAAPARSRRSILAFSCGEHALEVRHRDGVTVEHRPGSALAPWRRHDGGFFRWLRQAWPHTGAATHPEDRAEDHPDDPPEPFQLGWVGWLGYELRREVGSPDLQQQAPRAARPAADDAHLFRATHAVVLDHAAGQVEVQSLGEDPAWLREAALAWDEVLAAGPDSPASQPTAPEAEPPQIQELRVRDGREDYLAMIARAQREIYEGNTYEVCLTTAVTARAPADQLDALSLFWRLRAANRAPFTQLLRLCGAGGAGGAGAVDVLSTSPERYLSIDVAGTVRSEPIKGTRARSADPQADERLRQELAAHPKDRAENVMITDLVRNDLSIHAVPGTLRTERLCAVESYPTVHQMVSTVSARISPEVPRADVVAAAFPPGSMTGAPKISTMDILQRLETGPRGPYSGVAGYFSTTGAADLSVLIRTLVIAPGRPEEDEALLHLGLGGAIVADSDPADEWDEVVTKSAGVLGALGVEFPSR